MDEWAGISRQPTNQKQITRAISKQNASQQQQQLFRYKMNAQTFLHNTQVAIGKATLALE
jgi:hypothetical protein